MTRNRMLAAVAVVLLIAAGLYFYRRADASEASPYRFTEVEQGGLEATVSATGTLSAVKTVEVGTQVSGQVAAMNADFNDRVQKGQLIARIDPTLAQQAVRDAQASLDRSRAELNKAQRDFDRTEQLYDQKVVTESEFNTAEYSLAIARANLRSAQAGLDRAQQNLSYTYIYAPVDGVVIERNVDVGQTVAASLSAPTLFKIAEDLAQMEILASVDESDIGRIQQGQAVRFTVQAYPDRTFNGTVRQVRLQSTTLENVVNYTVVVGVDNPDRTLLPGMTATVDFLIETAGNVLKVSNAALRFRPTEQMMAQVRARREAEGRTLPDSARARLGGQGGTEAGGQPGGGRAGGGRPGGGQRPGDAARLWYLDESGQPAVMRVRTGISDGTMTQIIGPDVQPGMEVIVGVTQTTESGSTNPFQAQQQGAPGRGRPGSF